MSSLQIVLLILFKHIASIFLEDILYVIKMMSTNRWLFAFVARQAANVLLSHSLSVNNVSGVSLQPEIYMI